MNLDRALQFNTAALAVMGALFLGLGHESVLLPVALGVAAVVSVTLWERYRWLRLNRLIANLIALAAVIWSMRNFLNNGSEQQLLAIADMLVYLQIVLLFQEKAARVYWQLIVLSLLQVVVAAALNLGPQFGFLLAAYLVVALLALVLLCSYRETQKFAPTAPGSPQLDTPVWRTLLGDPSATSPQSASDATAAIRPAPTARRVGLIGLATLAFAGVFFYATPRHRDGAWADMRGGSNTSSGFVSQVALEEFGRIHLSNALVMRVTLTSQASGQPYVLMTEPYFHGMVLTEYVHDANGGRWMAGRPARATEQLPLSPALPQTTMNLVRQAYMLEGGANQLFAIMPVLGIDEMGTQISVRPTSNRLVRLPNPDESRTSREYRYATATSSLRNGRQLRGIPHRNRAITEWDNLRLKLEKDVLLQFDPQRFSGLSTAAEKALRDAGVGQGGPFEQAMALERHFTEPGRYHYSLSLNFQRDNKLDPIEDFVVNHRTGHCEYFASALVMMLRSRGIPARMVIGYKGGDFNSIGDYYQVRQRNSHAWVEALLPPGEAPEWELCNQPSGGGTWYRLDPTPSALGPLSESSDESVAGQMMQTFDYVELLWRDYVLSLNAMKQQDSIYEPVSNRAFNSLPPWVERWGLRRVLRRVSAILGMDPNAIVPRRSSDSGAFDWRTGALVVGMVVIVIVAAQGIYLVFLLLGRLRLGAGPHQHHRKLVPPAFYRRLETLLARLSLKRAAGQTARELAADAADRLEQGVPQAAVSELPAEIVDAYYRVRFGGAALDSQEQAAIEHALAELAPAVHQAQR